MLPFQKKSYDKPRQCIKKQRHQSANKDLDSQSYGFSSSHVQMWELDHTGGWVPKNWCFWTVVLDDNSWESLGLQGDQISQSEMKSTLNIHWKDCWWSSNILATWYKELTHWKRLWCWERDWKQKEKGAAENEIVRQHHQLNGHEFEQAPGDGQGQGSQVCCSPWGHKELDTTEQLNWTPFLCVICIHCVHFHKVPLSPKRDRS